MERERTVGKWVGISAEVAGFSRKELCFVVVEVVRREQPKRGPLGSGVPSMYPSTQNDALESEKLHTNELHSRKAMQ